MNEEPDEISERIVFGNGDFTRLMQARCDELLQDKKMRRKVNGLPAHGMHHEIVVEYY